MINEFESDAARGRAFEVWKMPRPNILVSDPDRKTHFGLLIIGCGALNACCRPTDR